MKKRRKNKSLLYVLVAFVIAITLTASFLKKDSIKKWFSTEEKANTSNETTPYNTKVNDINLAPSNPSDNQEINEKKNNADKTPGKQVSTDLSATITNTRVVDSNAQVSVLVNGAKEGNCVLTLSKNDSPDIQKTVPIIIKNGTVTCENFNIPTASLSSGVWKVRIVLETDQQKSSPAESSLQVN